MKILLIDNYDSFTFNLVHYLGELGAEISVVRNDAIGASEALHKGDAIVISPGPCDPDQSGICLELIKENASLATPLPLLGVCLGHQALGQAFGGKVVRAPKPMHGKVSFIRHEEKFLLKGLPNPFEATRYHSLVVAQEHLPACFTIDAVSEDDNLIMALTHKELPFFGVQFHPESIATQHGHALLGNFLEVASS